MQVIYRRKAEFKIRAALILYLLYALLIMLFNQQSLGSSSDLPSLPRKLQFRSTLRGEERRGEKGIPLMGSPSIIYENI